MPYPEGALELFTVEAPDVGETLEEAEDALVLGEGGERLERLLDQLTQRLRLQGVKSQGQRSGDRVGVKGHGKMAWRKVMVKCKGKRSESNVRV